MGAFAKRFDEAEQTTRFPNGNERILDLSGTPVGLATFEPGWRWSNDVRPLIGTERCPFRHRGYVLSGSLRVELQGGGTMDVAAGDLVEIPPDHDAWVVGSEPCRFLDWGGKVRENTQPAETTAGGKR